MTDMNNDSMPGDVGPAGAAPNQNLNMLSGVVIRVSVEVGSTSLRLSELMNLAKGSVVELERQTQDLLDILANGTLIAKGEIVEIEGRYGIRVVEVVTPSSRSGITERRS